MVWGLRAGAKAFMAQLPTASKFNLAATGALQVPEAGRQARAYSRQQARGIRAPGPAGDIPDMQKVSVRQALRFYLRKQAAGPASNFFGNLGMGVAKGVGTALAGSILGAGALGLGSVYQRFQAGRTFDELQRRYPEIKKNARARDYFDMIVAYAPSLMKHPAAIGDFLRRQLEYPMSSVEFVKQLAELENTVTGTRADRPGARFGEQVAQSSAKLWPHEPEK